MKTYYKLIISNKDGSVFGSRTYDKEPTKEKVEKFAKMIKKPDLELAIYKYDCALLDSWTLGKSE